MFLLLSSLKLGSSFISEKFGIEFRTSFLNKSNSELDGYVMSIVHDLEKDQSKLIIVDAENFSDKPIAEILLPQRVPFGAHGSWLES